MVGPPEFSTGEMTAAQAEPLRGAWPYVLPLKDAYIAVHHNFFLPRRQHLGSQQATAQAPGRCISLIYIP